VTTSRPDDAGPAGGYLERIPVRKRHEIWLVPVDEVAAVVADGELLHLTTTHNERHVLTVRLKDVAARLDPTRFMRLSRGTLVQTALITRLIPMPGGAYVAVLRNGQEIQVSRARARLVRERLLRL
jgi:two-component system LytT family response regulator